MHQKCEVIYLTTGLEVIFNLWRCSRCLIIKMGEKLVNETSEESKIKEIFFRIFIK